MRPRFPWGATLLVALAVAAMVGLGVWQLQRLKWKEALIARYTAAQASPSIRQWPDGSDIAPLSYSRVRVVCAAVTGQTAVSGENALHRAGWAHLANDDFAQLLTGAATRIYYDSGASQWKLVIEATMFVTGAVVDVWTGVKPVGNDPVGPYAKQSGCDPAALLTVEAV